MPGDDTESKIGRRILGINIDLTRSYYLSGLCHDGS